MKKISLFAGLLLLAISTIQAKIRRVGYFGSIVSGTDYGSFALAVTAASAGDTILIFPGAVATGAINKKLIIIGTGNWIDPSSTPKGNDNQQAFASTAGISGSISFQTGSEGSVITGLYGAGATIYVGANNITIRRNRNIIVNLAYNTNGTASNPITVNNLAILENYELAINYSYNAAGFGHTNLNVSNNFMESFSLNTTLNTYNGNISNNIWAYDGTTTATNGGASVLSSTGQIYLGNGAFLFQNNILCYYVNSSAANNSSNFIINDGGNTVFNYNVALQSNNNIGIGAGTGNIVVPIANAANIFADFPAIGTNTADARYRLKANSPALAANRPGSSADAGMYGGTTPYKLSTLPSIPSIYSLSSPQGNNPSGTTIQINLSTKGNN
jgi:hypothetical protein